LSTQAQHVQTPATAREAAQLLRGHAARGVAVRIAGAGTKPWGGAGAECGAELSTRGLDAIVEHNTGDLTAVLQPGVPLRELAEAFAEIGRASCRERV